MARAKFSIGNVAGFDRKGGFQSMGAALAAGCPSIAAEVECGVLAADGRSGVPGQPALILTRWRQEILLASGKANLGKVFSAMARFRPQFSLRLLLAIVTCCVVVAALVKCETDARRDFAAKVTIVETALRTILPAVDQELYETWLQDAKGTNPTSFAAWERDFGHLRLEHKIKMSVHDGGSQEGVAPDYFGSLHNWRIVRTTDSPTTDYSSLPVKGNQVLRVDVRVTCCRPCSIISRATSISIAENPAPDNKRLIERLKAELARNGTHYEIDGHP